MASIDFANVSAAGAIVFHRRALLLPRLRLGAPFATLISLERLLRLPLFSSAVKNCTKNGNEIDTAKPSTLKTAQIGQSSGTRRARGVRPRSRAARAEKLSKANSVRALLIRLCEPLSAARRAKRATEQKKENVEANRTGGGGVRAAIHITTSNKTQTRITNAPQCLRLFLSAPASLFSASRHCFARAGAEIRSSNLIETII